MLGRGADGPLGLAGHIRLQTGLGRGCQDPRLDALRDDLLPVHLYYWLQVVVIGQPVYTARDEIEVSSSEVVPLIGAAQNKVKRAFCTCADPRPRMIGLRPPRRRRHCRSLHPAALLAAPAPATRWDFASRTGARTAAGRRGCERRMAKAVLSADEVGASKGVGLTASALS